MRGELAGDSTCPLDLPETRRAPLFVVSPKHTTDKQNKQPFLAWRQQPPPPLLYLTLTWREEGYCLHCPHNTSLAHDVLRTSGKQQTQSCLTKQTDR